MFTDSIFQKVLTSLYYVAFLKKSEDFKHMFRSVQRQDGLRDQESKVSVNFRKHQRKQQKQIKCDFVQLFETSKIEFQYWTDS